MRLSTAEVAWDLLAPNNCEVWSEEDVETLKGRLGPDHPGPRRRPRTVVGNARTIFRPHRGSAAGPVGDCRVGNVYRAEVLLDAGVHPARSAFEVSREEFDVIWDSLKSRMAQGVEDGRIITFYYPEGFERSSLSEAEARYVYKQSDCRRCGSPVEVVTVGGRTAYALPQRAVLMQTFLPFADFERTAEALETAGWASSELRCCRSFVPRTRTTCGRYGRRPAFHRSGWQWGHQ